MKRTTLAFVDLTLALVIGLVGGAAFAGIQALVG